MLSFIPLFLSAAPADPPKAQPNMFQEILDYLYKTYGNVNLGQYENFGFSQTATTLTILIFGFMIGIILAAILIVINRNLAGAPVRILLEKEANTPETAIPYTELTDKKLARWLFRHNLAVKKTVCAVKLVNDESDESAILSLQSEELPHATAEEPAKTEAPTDEEGRPLPSESIHIDCMDYPIIYRLPKKYNLCDYALYIPEDLKHRAHFRFRKDRHSVRWIIITAVTFLAISLVILRFLPEFMKLLDNLISFIVG